MGCGVQRPTCLSWQLNDPMSETSLLLTIVACFDCLLWHGIVNSIPKSSDSGTWHRPLYK